MKQNKKPTTQSFIPWGKEKAKFELKGWVIKLSFVLSIVVSITFKVTIKMNFAIPLTHTKSSPIIDNPVKINIKGNNNTVHIHKEVHELPKAPDRSPALESPIHYICLEKMINSECDELSNRIGLYRLKNDSPECFIVVCYPKVTFPTNTE